MLTECLENVFTLTPTITANTDDVDDDDDDDDPCSLGKQQNEKRKLDSHSLLFPSSLFKSSYFYFFLVPLSWSNLYWSILVIRAGALVWWLREETHVLKVVSSNPSTAYWLTFSYIYLFVLKIVMFVWKDENKLKRGREWHKFINHLII